MIQSGAEPGLKNSIPNGTDNPSALHDSNIKMMLKNQTPNGTDAPPVLSISNLVRRRDGRTILDGIHLDIMQGEHLCVRGPSGCGKSTLLRAIAGLDVPEDGCVSICGRMVSGDGTWVQPHQRNLGFVFQTPALWSHMTLAENIRFGLHGMVHQEREQRLDHLLMRFSLTALRNRHPDEVSGGEARRASIARSMGPKPALLLLDEPMTHLDETLRNEALAFLLEEANSAGTTMLFVTHDAEEAKRIAPRSFVWKDMEWILE